MFRLPFFRRRRPEPQAADCLLFITHDWSPAIAAALAALEAAVGRRFDIHLLIDDTAGSAVPDLPGRRLHRFTADLVTDPAYPAKAAHHPGTVWPLNIDLPVLWFFRAYPGYGRYWMMEYDVRFTGDWAAFFDAFEDNDAALLGTTLYRHAFRPSWRHWETLTAPEPLAEHERVRGLFPLCRLTRDALALVDAGYRQGWGGHYEATFPSLLLRAGLRIEDFGGDGEFVAPGNRNRFYRNTPANPSLMPGTFTVSPTRIDPELPGNLLWHPIKG